MDVVKESMKLVSQTEAEKDERGRRWRQLIASGDPCMENNVEEGQHTYTAFVVLEWNIWSFLNDGDNTCKSNEITKNNDNNFF